MPTKESTTLSEPYSAASFEASVRSVDEVRPAASIEKIGPSGAMSPIAGDVSTWPGVV